MLPRVQVFLNAGGRRLLHYQHRWMHVIRMTGARVPSLRPLAAGRFSEISSRRGMAHAVDDAGKSAREAEIMRLLQEVSVPGESTDAVYSGHVTKIREDHGSVEIELRLSSHYRKLKRDIQSSLKQLSWVTSVDIKMEAAHGPQAAPRENTGHDHSGCNSSKRQHQGDSNPSQNGLEHVGSILAVGSCKGGVGKSTVAVNLAFTLAKQGFRVGVLDADIYGPSLPTMVQPEDRSIYQTKSGLLEPLEFEKVKLMSYGYIQQAKGEKGGSILRGPIVSGIVKQMATQTDWGQLDYLLVDMPPGTGDITLTLAQSLQINAAVVVSTPHKLSFIDVVKGMDMFQRLNVPMISVVENMAFFKCGECDTRHRIFGQGFSNRLKEEFGIPHLVELPLLPHLAGSSDSELPFAMRRVGDLHPSEVEVVGIYDALADNVRGEVQRLKSGSILARVVFDADKKIITLQKGESSLNIQPRHLRLKCRCAGCVDEISGVEVLDEKTVPLDVVPTQAPTPCGNYAVEITWSDGHQSIYAHEYMSSLAT